MSARPYHPVTLFSLVLLVALVAGVLGAVGYRTWQRERAKEAEQGAVVVASPNLGIEFWQYGRQRKLYEVGAHSGIVTLNSQKFELRFPRLPNDMALRICAWLDTSILERISPGVSVSDVDYFMPGTALSEATSAADEIYIDKTAHNYFHRDRYTAVSDEQNSILVSSLGGDERIQPEGIERVYIVVFADLNSNRVIDDDEFDFFALRFEYGVPID